jgi:enoyl-CoA hydratase/carnithine racemase
MATDMMLAEKDGPVGRMIFNNPKRHNAVSGDMWEAAGKILEDFIEDDAVRVIVLTGAGRKAFVAGADISKFEDERANAAAEKVYSARIAKARDLLLNAPKPTIAMIRGYCIGGGVATAISCDLRICSDNARFGVPAARLGLGYDYDGIARLIRLVGPNATKEIFFTARQFSAQEAFDMRLVDRVVPDDTLEEFVRDYAATIAANAPLTMRAVKQAVIENAKEPDARDYELVRRMVNQCNDSADYQEGRRAFMEKRQPVFVGK